MVKVTDQDALRNAEIRVLRQKDVERCPHCIMLPSHFREDGSCKCNDPNELCMAEWGYEWDGVGWVSPKDDE